LILIFKKIRSLKKELLRPRKNNILYLAFNLAIL